MSRIASRFISSRPFGTGRPFRSNPGLASWAKFSRPFGTESPAALLMNKRECGAAPPALDRLPMDPALPGWADFWCRPSGPALQTPLPMFIPPLTCAGKSAALGMTKERVSVKGEWVFGPAARSWVSKASKAFAGFQNRAIAVASPRRCVVDRARLAGLRARCC